MAPREQWHSSFRKVNIMTLATFCGYCNYISEEGTDICVYCQKKMSLVTESHRGDNVFFLSGLGARKIWDTTPDRTDILSERFTQINRESSEVSKETVRVAAQRFAFRKAPVD